ncbi:MAG TPA: hypothetical protein VFY84_02870 [Jiangellales bacterium]|nr:hypothetical protein [Jiangellales bacterium]
MGCSDPARDQDRAGTAPDPEWEARARDQVLAPAWVQGSVWGQEAVWGEEAVWGRASGPAREWAQVLESGLVLAPARVRGAVR